MSLLSSTFLALVLKTPPHTGDCMGKHHETISVVYPNATIPPGIALLNVVETATRSL